MKVYLREPSLTASAVANHPIHDLLERLLALEGSGELGDPDVSGDESLSHARDKIFLAARLVRSYLQQTPPLLVSVHGLTQLQTALQPILDELRSFVSNKNGGHIQNASALVDQNVFPQMWAFAPRFNEGGTQAAIEVVNTLAAEATATFKTLQLQRDAAHELVSKLAKTIDEQQVRLEALTETVAVQKLEAMTVVTQVQQAHAEKETERGVAFQASMRAIESRADSAFADIREETTETLKALADSRAQAAKIVQVVGNIGVTGNYQIIANQEGSAANAWRYATIAFFATGVGLAGATFYEFWGKPVGLDNVWSILVRLMYAVAITAPA